MGQDMHLEDNHLTVLEFRQLQCSLDELMQTIYYATNNGTGSGGLKINM